MDKLRLLTLIILSLFLTSCTIITYDRVFPKVTWYWSKEAKMQRQSQEQIKIWDSQQTNSVKDIK